MAKRIVQAVNTSKRYDWTKQGPGFCWAELIALYDDGTWETLFKYQWAYDGDGQFFNSGRLRNHTKDEAVLKLEQDHYSGKLKGVFMV